MRIRDLGAWFQNPSAYCSSHHGADSYERGVFGAYVYENYAAWTQGNANPYCLSIELCGYAEWSRSEWLNNRPILVDNAAEWLRYIVDKYGIPWTVLTPSQAQNPNTRGICQHRDLGAWGSGHSDCGDGFPIDVVIQKAQGSAPKPPQPIPVTEDEEMPAIYPGSDPRTNPDVSWSFPMFYTQMGWFADVGLFSETDKVKVRVALHNKNGSWYVHNIELSKAQPKAAISFAPDFDSASIRRLDDVPIVLYPNAK